MSLFRTLVLLCLDDPVDDSPRRDVLGRLLLHDVLGGKVVGPRLGVVSPRRDVRGRVRERDLGLDGVDDGSDLLSGTPLSAIFGLERSFKSQGTWREEREPRSGSLSKERGNIAKRCIQGLYNDGPFPGAEVKVCSQSILMGLARLWGHSGRLGLD